jgi:hypothetical protein
MQEWTQHSFAPAKKTKRSESTRFRLMAGFDGFIPA